MPLRDIGGQECALISDPLLPIVKHNFTELTGGLITRKWDNFTSKKVDEFSLKNMKSRAVFGSTEFNNYLQRRGRDGAAWM